MIVGFSGAVYTSKGPFSRTSARAHQPRGVTACTSDQACSRSPVTSAPRSRPKRELHVPQRTRGAPSRRSKLNHVNVVVDASPDLIAPPNPDCDHARRRCVPQFGKGPRLVGAVDLDRQIGAIWAAPYHQVYVTQARLLRWRMRNLDSSLGARKPPVRERPSGYLTRDLSRDRPCRQ